jgi:putative nucleotidyltransferase with HDIG domain
MAHSGDATGILQTDIRRNILDELKQIRDLPTLPSVFMRILRALRDTNPSAKNIATIVESDQAITMRILRLINSSFYGLSRRVDSVQQAVVLLGTSTLKNVVMSASVFRALGGGSQGAALNREAFWQHSIGCGVIARFLCRQVNGGRDEEAFIGGIIHDIGKVVLDQYFHDELLKILHTSNERQISFWQAEIEELGISHAEIGAALADIWSLPKNLVEVVGQHHQLQAGAPYAKLVALVQIADALARQYKVGGGGDDLVPEIDPLSWKILGMDSASVPGWDEAIRLEIAKGDELLGVLLK